jgi:signal transduction histidine kinase
MSSAVSRWFTAEVARGVTNPPAPRPSWLRRGPFDLVFLADVMVAVICFATTDSWLETQNGRHHHPFSTVMLLLFAAAVCAPLVLRTRFPATAWAASAAALAWTTVVIGPTGLSSAVYPPAGLLVYALCLYSVAVRCRAAFVIGAAGVTVVGAIFVDLRTSAGAILAAIPLLIGAIVRSRRSSRAELAQQAERLEGERAVLEGERALLEERQRIARELHDIVAHHMSVIAIQAEAAPRKVTDPPPELAESFAEIRSSALSGLDELRRLLGVLRSHSADTAPQPGLGELPGLLESARSGGVRVTSSVSGVARPLPQGVDLSAYRIVQEALSNAMRHAPGSAVRVELAYSPSSLVIKVRNAPAPPGASAAMRRPSTAAQLGAGPDPDYPGIGGNGAGQGIIGMRERAAMLGGHLDAGPTRDGGFLLTAVLPDKDGAEGSP